MDYHVMKDPWLTAAERKAGDLRWSITPKFPTKRTKHRHEEQIKKKEIIPTKPPGGKLTLKKVEKTPKGKSPCVKEKIKENKTNIDTNMQEQEEKEPERREDMGKGTTNDDEMDGSYEIVSESENPIQEEREQQNLSTT